MRVGFPGGPRLEWYDRNPQSVDEGALIDDTAPHSLTTRFTYTVPTGKKCFVELAMVHMLRSAAASSVEKATVEILARGTYVVAAEIETNNVGDRASMVVGRNCIMLAGDVIAGRTVDGSTGGTIDYMLGFMGIEFDT